MRHFRSLTTAQNKALFHRLPVELSAQSAPELLAVALGGTLYTPANRPQLVKDVLRQRDLGAVSMVLCLEDSIPDSDVAAAEDNVVAALGELSGMSESLPLLFVRVRTPEQLLEVARRAGAATGMLTGFVIPKFDNETGIAAAFLNALHTVQAELGLDGRGDGRRLRIMPILESPAIIHLETRAEALTNIYTLLDANREDILSVRIGATDMSSAFGLRRSRDLSIYDVFVVANVIGDIVNILGRPDGGFVISGPVWEHYAATERVLRPQLRATPFVGPHEEELRRRIMTANLDTLIREIELDLANGLLGKTVIHPTHVNLVHAMSVVSHEEYLDAVAIAGNVNGGAAASPYRNKMNEMKPHQAWARRTLLRADAFGVAGEGVTFVDFLEVGMA
ncbi:citrate lyase beta subunit [Arthrobacter stackebrandtii]|uniref:Citrate lyase beta subunit n=1 Tax=Arthrobacter stackebrandtii TaxID=272161 RepID=A0ABS4YW97_9MICC|nr:HpcH/HpaI aldolase/citrate lyase family protein [Arthrobacter stackebrandtii]MBP2412760.1 citrate lyase beta subunit [Arthrobacter stackebrandtii]PYG99883.1 ATP/GTP-binding protein [Arthrobacter stackebrandtii]